MARKFDKYEGLGNDFVLVEAEGPLDPTTVRKVCDRHFGVGSDGVLVLGPATAEGARARMVIQNADGTRPEMCGNGLRCAGLHLARLDGVDRADYSIETDAGLLACAVRRDGNEAIATVGMGRAVALGEIRITLGGEERTFDRISMGNPHAVYIDPAPDGASADRWGPRVSESIPGGSNVELVSLRSPTECDVVVWERGVGRTLACGTGAAATAVALACKRRVPFGQSVQVHLPGGALAITVEEDSLEVALEGPARHVFAGELTP